MPLPPNPLTFDTYIPVLIANEQSLLYWHTNIESILTLNWLIWNWIKIISTVVCPRVWKLCISFWFIFKSKGSYFKASCRSTGTKSVNPKQYHIHTCTTSIHMTISLKTERGLDTVNWFTYLNATYLYFMKKNALLISLLLFDRQNCLQSDYHIVIISLP